MNTEQLVVVECFTTGSSMGLGSKEDLPSTVTSSVKSHAFGKCAPRQDLPLHHSGSGIWWCVCAAVVVGEVVRSKTGETLF